MSASKAGTLHTGNPVTQVLLDVEFPDEGPYTAEFKITPEAGPSPSFPLRCKGTLTWEVHGRTVTRVIDITNGTSVQGIGQSVSIVITDDTKAGGAVNIDYDVSVQVTPGTRADDALPPILTVLPTADTTGSPINLLAASASVTQDIPQNSGVKSYAFLFAGLNDAATAPALAVVLYKSSQFVAKHYVDTSQNGKFFPLLCNADSMTIINRDAANGVAVTPIFGIDG